MITTTTDRIYECVNMYVFDAEESRGVNGNLRGSSEETTGSDPRLCKPFVFKLGIQTRYRPVSPAWMQNREAYGKAYPPEIFKAI